MRSSNHLRSAGQAGRREPGEDRQPDGRTLRYRPGSASTGGRR
jgi:hypothetical protein